jgi:hypothetical protein
MGKCGRFAMKVESAFVCDDVRQEGNGKLIFIGAYSQDIILPMFPMVLNLHVVLCLNYDKPSTFELEVESFLDDKRQLKGSLTVNNTGEGFGFLNFPLPLNIEGPSTLKVQLRVGQAKWNEVLRVQIKPAKPIPANDSLPPS